MNRQETMSTDYDEMLDMIACLSVYNGTAEIDNGRRITSVEEALKLE